MRPLIPTLNAVFLAMAVSYAALPPPVAAQSPGTARVAADSPSPSRGARTLLRNGLDYLKYQEYERALIFLRKAQARQEDLDPAEVQALKLAIAKAEKATKAVATAERGKAGGPAAATAKKEDQLRLTQSLPAAAADADAVEIAPDVVPMTPDLNSFVPAAAAASAPPAVAVQPSAGLGALPPLPVAGESMLTPQPAPAPAPAAAPTPAPAAAAPDLQPSPEVLTLTPAPVAELAARPEQDTPPAPNLPPLPDSPPAPPPASAPSSTPAEPSEGLPPLPVGAEPSNPPAGSDLSPPLPTSPAAPSASPTTNPAASRDLEPLPASTLEPPPVPVRLEDPTPLPPASSSPRDLPPPAEVDEVAPRSAQRNSLPPITTTPTLSQTNGGLPAQVGPLRDITPPRTDRSLLTPDLQREVETIARRMREQQPTADQVTPSMDPRDDDLNEGTGGRLEIPRAPSPTEARPIKAIPLPEEFVSMVPRQWSPNRKYWAAAATCHSTLYFQDPVLERYGQSVEQKLGHAGRFLTYPIDDKRQSKLRAQIAQPLFSVGLFWAQAITLPYKIAVDPPWEAEYDLGYWRPGDKVPPDLWYVPAHGIGPPLHANNY